MDAIIVSLLVIAVICYACYRRKFSTAVYGIAVIDIFLRIVNYIIYKYFDGVKSGFFYNMPGSLLGLTDKYLSGFFFELFAFAYIVIMACFLFYTARDFIKKK